MATHERNTTGLKMIGTFEEASRLAQLSALKRQLSEPVARVQVGIFKRQQEEIQKRGLKTSALVRQLLDEWMAR